MNSDGRNRYAHHDGRKGNITGIDLTCCIYMHAAASWGYTQHAAPNLPAPFPIRLILATAHRTPHTRACVLFTPPIFLFFTLRVLCSFGGCFFVVVSFFTLFFLFLFGFICNPVLFACGSAFWRLLQPTLFGILLEWIYICAAPNAHPAYLKKTGCVCMHGGYLSPLPSSPHLLTHLWIEHASHSITRWYVFPPCVAEPHSGPSSNRRYC